MWRTANACVCVCVPAVRRSFVLPFSACSSTCLGNQSYGAQHPCVDVKWACEILMKVAKKMPNFRRQHTPHTYDAYLDPLLPYMAVYTHTHTLHTRDSMCYLVMLRQSMLETTNPFGGAWAQRIFLCEGSGESRRCRIISFLRRNLRWPWHHISFDTHAIADIHAHTRQASTIISFEEFVSKTQWAWGDMNGVRNFGVNK